MSVTTHSTSFEYHSNTSNDVLPSRCKFRESPEDKLKWIFAELNVVDANAELTKEMADQPLAAWSKKTSKLYISMLTEKISIVSRSNSVLSSVRLASLLLYLKKNVPKHLRSSDDAIQVVGGILHLLHVSGKYYFTALKALGIWNKEIKELVNIILHANDCLTDHDLRFYASQSDSGGRYQIVDLIDNYLNINKGFQNYKDIDPYINPSTKIINVKDNAFFILSFLFRSENNPNFRSKCDIDVVTNLARHYLFDNIAVCLDGLLDFIYDNFAPNSDENTLDVCNAAVEAFMASHDPQIPKLIPFAFEDKNAWQAIISRLIKVIYIDEPEKINQNGWPTLVIRCIKGFRLLPKRDISFLIKATLKAIKDSKSKKKIETSSLKNHENAPKEEIKPKKTFEVAALLASKFDGIIKKHADPSFFSAYFCCAYTACSHLQDFFSKKEETTFDSFFYAFWNNLLPKCKNLQPLGVLAENSIKNMQKEFLPFSLVNAVIQLKLFAAVCAKQIENDAYGCNSILTENKGLPSYRWSPGLDASYSITLPMNPSKAISQLYNVFISGSQDPEMINALSDFIFNSGIFYEVTPSCHSQIRPYVDELGDNFFDSIVKLCVRNIKLKNANAVFKALSYQLLLICNNIKRQNNKYLSELFETICNVLIACHKDESTSRLLFNSLLSAVGCKNDDPAAIALHKFFMERKIDDNLTNDLGTIVKSSNSHLGKLIFLFYLNKESFLNAASYDELEPALFYAFLKSNWSQALAMFKEMMKSKKKIFTQREKLTAYMLLFFHRNDPKDKALLDAYFPIVFDSILDNHSFSDDLLFSFTQIHDISLKSSYLDECLTALCEKANNSKAIFNNTAAQSWTYWLRNIHTLTNNDLKIIEKWLSKCFDSSHALSDPATLHILNFLSASMAFRELHEDVKKKLLSISIEIDGADRINDFSNVSQPVLFSYFLLASQHLFSTYNRQNKINFFNLTLQLLKKSFLQFDELKQIDLFVYSGNFSLTETERDHEKLIFSIVNQISRNYISLQHYEDACRGFCFISGKNIEIMCQFVASSPSFFFDVLKNKDASSKNLQNVLIEILSHPSLQMRMNVHSLKKLWVDIYLFATEQQYSLLSLHSAVVLSSFSNDRKKQEPLFLFLKNTISTCLQKNVCSDIELRLYCQIMLNCKIREISFFTEILKPISCVTSKSTGDTLFKLLEYMEEECLFSDNENLKSCHKLFWEKITLLPLSLETYHRLLSYKNFFSVFSTSTPDQDLRAHSMEIYWKIGLKCLDALNQELSSQIFVSEIFQRLFHLLREMDDVLKSMQELKMSWKQETIETKQNKMHLSRYYYLDFSIKLSISLLKFDDPPYQGIYALREMFFSQYIAAYVDNFDYEKKKVCQSVNDEHLLNIAICLFKNLKNDNEYLICDLKDDLIYINNICEKFFINKKYRKKHLLLISFQLKKHPTIILLAAKNINEFFEIYGKSNETHSSLKNFYRKIVEDLKTPSYAPCTITKEMVLCLKNGSPLIPIKDLEIIKTNFDSLTYGFLNSTLKVVNNIAKIVSILCVFYIFLCHADIKTHKSP